MADWLGRLEGQVRIGSRSLIDASRDCSIQDLIFLWFVSVQKEEFVTFKASYIPCQGSQLDIQSTSKPFNVWDIFHKCVYSSIN